MKRIVLLLTLALGVAMSQPASAQSDLGLKRLGASIGYVSPEGLDGTLGVGVFADLGTITPNIGLETRLDYWSQSEEAFGSEASIHDIALGVRGKYLFTIKDSKIRPFAGAGLSMHFIEAEVTISDPGFPPMTASDSSTELGLDLAGGMATSVSPRVDLHAELGYVLVSDIDQFSLRMGMSFKLGS